MPKLLSLIIFCYISCISCLFCFAGEGEKKIIRIGHFPNITHAQGLIAHQLSRQGKGIFEKKLGPDVEVQWYVYNAGPLAMEAIFADTIDLTYVGPSPTINAYSKAQGTDIRIVSGACSGGVALVVQPDGRIKTNADFKGKKIGTPQFGNTQDVACRSWLRSLGYRVTQTGGDVLVIPTDPPDQLELFKQGVLDGVWTVEPWVSRLVMEANGKIYLEESSLWPETHGQYVTTQLVSSKALIDKHPDLLKKCIAAHVELTEWIKANPEQAQELIRQEIKDETKIAVSAQLLASAWKRMEVTYDPIRLSLQRYAQQAFNLGFLKEKPDLKDIYSLDFLNEVLSESGKQKINGSS